RLTPVVRPLRDAVIGDVGTVLWVLMGTVGLVLLIACANVANLLLVRADGRQQELAIRAALGAGRGRLALEMLAESVTLGALGGARTQSAGKDRHFARSTLVVVQVALAVVLLVGSGLMIRTFQAMRHVPAGFSAPEQVQTFRISIPSAQIREEEAVVRMTQAIADRIAATPGVDSVAMTSNVPMTTSGWHDPIFTADRPSAETLPAIRTFRFISPGFFE